MSAFIRVLIFVSKSGVAYDDLADSLVNNLREQPIRRHTCLRDFLCVYLELLNGESSSSSDFEVVLLGWAVNHRSQEVSGSGAVLGDLLLSGGLSPVFTAGLVKPCLDVRLEVLFVLDTRDGVVVLGHFLVQTAPTPTSKNTSQKRRKFY